MKRALAVVLMIVFFSGVHADEGMWIPSLIKKYNLVEMKKMGFELEADDIFSTQNPSMSDAVVALDGGRCTGEIISSQGLLLTNHHCGYNDLQSVSTLENNYIENGFWSNSLTDEIPIEGKTASIIHDIIDITDVIEQQVSDSLSEQVRMDSIQTISNRLEKKYTRDNQLLARTKRMFAGNQFFIILYQTYKDVRLVGAPPRFIGKFGADTDNWMWPRHTGDFCLFRIYADSTGNPAEYSENNVPYKPRHYFPISIKGYDENDFTMTLGFPGTTTRYLTSFEVNSIMNVTNKVRSIVRSKKLEIMKNDMKNSEEIFLKYAGSYSSSSNYYKYSVGQNKAFDRLGTIESKEKLEKQFHYWLENDSAYKEQFGNVLPTLANAYENLEYPLVNNFISEAFLYGPEIFFFSARFNELKKSRKYKKQNPDYYARRIERLKTINKNHFDEYHAATDQKIVAALATLYADNLERKFHPEFLKKALKRYDGDLNRWANDLFEKSIFSSFEKVENFIDNPRPHKLEKDPALKAMNEIYRLRKKVNEMRIDRSSDVEQSKRLWQKGLMTMLPEKTFYPNANSTLRMSYGTIGGYQPADAIQYNYFTTIDGKIKKGIPDDYEFDIWPSFIDLYNKKDFGRYADKQGNLRTCFISNNDITGGNSGSPVLNKKGELIGVAFDGNWESMSGDVQYENELQKCISVDIRYVLWVIDKFAKADRIINEMTIIE